MVTALGTLALASPAVAAETTTTAPTPTAEQQCRTERAGMGKDAFAATYGTNRKRSNAFGKCVSARASATAAAKRDARSNAAKDCRAEQAADPAAFKAKYGTGKQGRNAFGKCVSQKAKSEADKRVADEVAADVDAAKACKAERKADPAAFATKYGTNRNHRNAFGKCVSQKAKSGGEAPSSSS